MIHFLDVSMVVYINVFVCHCVGWISFEISPDLTLVNVNFRQNLSKNICKVINICCIDGQITLNKLMVNNIKDNDLQIWHVILVGYNQSHSVMFGFQNYRWSGDWDIMIKIVLNLHQFNIYLFRLYCFFYRKMLYLMVKLVIFIDNNNFQIWE